MSVINVNPTNPVPGVTYTTSTLTGARADIVVTDEQGAEGVALVRAVESDGADAICRAGEDVTEGCHGVSPVSAFSAMARENGVDHRSAD